MSLNTPLNARSKPANFNWEDPFLLEDQLTEEERMIRDTANAYCQDKLMPRIIEANRNEVFHREIMNEMGELGLLGSTIPEEFGGVGANYTSYGLSCSRSRARGQWLSFCHVSSIIISYASNFCIWR